MLGASASKVRASARQIEACLHSHGQLHLVFSAARPRSPPVCSPPKNASSICAICWSRCAGSRTTTTHMSLCLMRRALRELTARWRCSSSADTPPRSADRAPRIMRSGQLAGLEPCACQRFRPCSATAHCQYQRSSRSKQDQSVATLYQQGVMRRWTLNSPDGAWWSMPRKVTAQWGVAMSQRSTSRAGCSFLGVSPGP